MAVAFRTKSVRACGQRMMEELGTAVKPIIMTSRRIMKDDKTGAQLNGRDGIKSFQKYCASFSFSFS